MNLEQALGFESVDKRIEILRCIDETGSISEAARHCGVSYKAAWQAVETLTNLAGVALLNKAVGGTGGGGARLTDEGRQVLQVSQQFAVLKRQLIHQLDQGGVSAGVAQGVLSSSLRTSMRNQIPCVVRSLKNTSGLVSVRLALQDKQVFDASITLESAQLLGLKRGMKVTAMLKATAVTLRLNRDTSEQFNLLQGILAAGFEDSESRECTVWIADNLSLRGFFETPVTFAAGHIVYASFAREAVVIAV